MARSLSEAFEDVAGPKLDRAAGFLAPPHPHAPVRPAVRRAYSTFDPGRLEAIVKRLAARGRCHRADAEDAVSETFADSFESDPGAYGSDREEWWRSLERQAWYRMLASTRRGPRLASFDGLVDAGDDGALGGAAVPVSPSVADHSEDVASPGPGESWGYIQAIGALQRFHRFHGRSPTSSECLKMNLLPSATTLCRLFGSFNAALLAAGMPASRVRRKRWTAVDSARVCDSFRRRHGRPADGTDVRYHPGELPPPAAMSRHFGSTRSGAVHVAVEAILASPAARRQRRS